MDIDTSKSIVFSLVQAVIASAWVLKYGTVRKARRYSKEREAVARDERFRVVGKVIFVVMNLVTVASFWSSSGLIVLLWRNDSLRLAGIFLLTCATLLYIPSMKHLGDNYSPFFDSYLPFRIVTNGPYRYVRHPVYLANILLAAGYLMTSGSLWIVVFGGYGVLKIIRAMRDEEVSLTKSLPAYRAYEAKTARLIPFIY